MISSGTLNVTDAPAISRTADGQTQIVLSCEDPEGNLPTRWTLVMVGAAADVATATARQLGVGSTIDVICYSPCPMVTDGQTFILAQCLDIQAKRMKAKAGHQEVAA